jgi:uncharacterized small protein (DUF1192 family)
MMILPRSMNGRRPRWWTPLTLALLIVPGAGATAPAAAAQTVRPAGAGEDLEDRLRELEALVAVLKEEIARLRAAGAAAGGGVAVAELEKRIEALSQEIERLRIGEAAAPAAGESVLGFGPAASKVYRVRRGVSVGGYGEMLYENFARTRDDGAAANAASQADFLRAVLYFGYKFDDRFLFNSEIEFEHAQAGEGKAGEVSVEFAYLDYRAAPGFGLRGGVLLAPMGFLNELHEPPIFHGARRPQVEQVILPSTWRDNGVGVFGEFGALAYRVYLVNSLKASGFTESSGIRGGRQSAARALATDLAWTARLDWTPRPGLLIGVSGFTGKTGQGVRVDTDPDPMVTTLVRFPDGRLSLWDAHLEWKWRGLQARGVYARGILGDAAEIGALIDSDSSMPGIQRSAIGERQVGWYAEAAYNILSGRGKGEQDLSLFCRYEEFDTQERVAAIDEADASRTSNDRAVRTCGLTYRPIPNIAVKIDAMDFRNEAGTAVDQVNFALGYLF